MILWRNPLACFERSGALENQSWLIHWDEHFFRSSARPNHWQSTFPPDRSASPNPCSDFRVRAFLRALDRRTFFHFFRSRRTIFLKTTWKWRQPSCTILNILRSIHLLFLRIGSKIHKLWNRLSRYCWRSIIKLIFIFIFLKLISRWLVLYSVLLINMFSVIFNGDSAVYANKTLFTPSVIL